MFIEQIIRHTPVWVWAMLAYLVYQGAVSYTHLRAHET